MFQNFRAAGLLLTNPPTTRRERAQAVATLGTSKNPLWHHVLEHVALDDPDEATRLAAAKALATVRSRSSRWMLVGVFSSRLQPRPRRLSALAALEITATSYEAPALCATLIDPDREVREAVERVLERLGPLACPALVVALRSPTTEGRSCAAARMLGRIGGDEAIRTLVMAADDRRAAVRESVVHSLAGLGEPAARWLVRELDLETPCRPQRVLLSVLEHCPYPAAASWFCRLLSSRDPEQAGRARAALARFGGAAVPGLIACLHQGPPDQREQAAAVLGRIGGEAAIEPLTRALREENSRARDAAAEALLRVGKEVVPEVERVLREACSQSEAEAAAQLLAALGHAGAVALVAAVEDAEEPAAGVALEVLARHGASRSAVLTALNEHFRGEGAVGAAKERHVTAATAARVLAAHRTFADPNAPPLPAVADLREELAGALGDRDPAVRGVAAWGLGRLGDPWAIPHLAQCLEGWDWRGRRVLLAALTRLGWSPSDPTAQVLLAVVRRDWETIAAAGLTVVAPLCHLLGGESAEVRQTAREHLVRLGAAAGPALRAVLREGRGRGPVLAAQILGDLGDPRTVAGLGAGLESTEAPIRSACADALARMGTLRAAEGLCRAVGGAPPRVARVAARALARMGSAAVPPTCRLLESRDPERRLAAIRVLTAIGDRSALPALESRQFWIRWVRRGSEELETLRAAIREIDARTAATADLPLPAAGTPPDLHGLPLPELKEHGGPE
jgi:HEAT repeat protein